MLRIRMFAALLLPAIVLVAALFGGSKTARSSGIQKPQPRYDLFYNYYVPPVPCSCYGAEGAELYVSPRPTPPLVGHTYITYQPLMPHELLYKHHRCYYRDNGPYAGVTRAHVFWW